MGSLVLEEVRKEFAPESVPVQNVSLTVEQGEFLALLGPSGCGKSTLLRMIAGLEEVSAGRILLNGRDITSMAPGVRNVAMVFQSYALYPHMTVAANIATSLKIRGVKKSEQQRKVAEVAETLGISEILTKKPAELSGGQRQRVAVARALVRDPEVFLLDEPLSNLDALLRERVRAELTHLFRTQERPVVYVTHDQTEAMSMASRIAVLDQGVVQQVGTPEEIYSSPRNEFVASFIGTPQINLFTMGGSDSRCALGAYLLGNGLQAASVGDNRVGVRPEHIRLQKKEAGCGVPGRVVHIEDHGREYLVSVRLDESRETLRCLMPRQPVEMNQEVSLEIAPDYVHCFGE